MTPQEPAMGGSDEAVEAAAMAIFEDQCPLDSWNAPMEDEERESWRDCARTALLAALPHMQPAGEAVACKRARIIGWWNCDCAECREYAKQNTLTTPPQPSAEQRQEAQGAVATVCFDNSLAIVKSGIELEPGTELFTALGAIRLTTPPAPVDVRLPSDPLEVFSAGAWTYSETGQAFTAADLDEAAFVAYRALLSAQQPSADAPLDADEERLLGPLEEHFGRAYIDAACVDGVWTHPDHVFEFIDKRARELHEAAIAAQREAGSA